MTARVHWTRWEAGHLVRMTTRVAPARVPAWKHWVLGTLGALALSFDGCGCGGTADPAPVETAYCDAQTFAVAMGVETSGDRAVLPMAWIHWEQVSGVRALNCYYDAPDGSAWVGSAAQADLTESPRCPMTNGSARLDLIVSDNSLWLAAENNHETDELLGRCP